MTLVPGTRLERTVAITILPEILAADPQLRDRFDREARAISQLTHAHICGLGVDPPPIATSRSLRQREHA